jgi:hypothetical protein
MPQLVIRHPDGPPSAISRNAHILQELCLPSETLDTLGFTPDESWSEFFEFRLRPMIYLVHARVMQDFSLIGRKGVYSLSELEEIQRWVQQTLLHCVSVDSRVMDSQLILRILEAPPGVQKSPPAGVRGQFQRLLPSNLGHSWQGSSHVRDHVLDLPLDRFSMQR